MEQGQVIKNHFLNKVVFLKSLNKIQNESIRNYFFSFFKVQNLLFKFILFVVLGIIVLGCGFGIEMEYIHNHPDEIVLNHGVGFSFGKDFGSSVVYLIQSIPIVISLIAFVFIPQWWITPGFLMMMFGGLSNIIDRSLDFDIPGKGSSIDAVVDYWKFGSTKININDVWICIGVGFIVLALIVWLVLLFKNSNAEAQNQNAKPNNELANNNLITNPENPSQQTNSELTTISPDIDSQTQNQNELNQSSLPEPDLKSGSENHSETI